MEDVSDIICSRNHKSGSNPDLSVCLLLVRHCRRQHEREWLVVLGVFLGTWLWWGGLTAAVSLARKKKRKNSFQRANRIFGAVLSLFGVLVFIKALPI